jgi:predicted transcriptional regulator
MPKEYRSRTRILLDILRAVRDEKVAAVTRLLFLANLSHDRLTGYLKELQEKGWVREDSNENRRVFELTEEGRAVLLEIERVARFMDDFGLGL